MNLISHSHAYSLYPYATFEERVSIHTPTPASVIRMDKHKKAREKYTRRGWSMAPTPSAAAYLRPNSEFRNALRCVGDSKCWIIPLEPLDVLEETSLYQDISMHLEGDVVRAHAWENMSTLLNKFVIERFLYGLEPTFGLLDCEFARVVHKLCKAYNNNVTINGEKLMGPHRGGNTELCAGFCIIRLYPCNTSRGGSLLPPSKGGHCRAAHRGPNERIFILSAEPSAQDPLHHGLQSCCTPISSAAFYPFTHQISEQSTVGLHQENYDPPAFLCVWTDVIISPPSGYDHYRYALKSPFKADEKFIDWLKDYRIHLTMCW
ncbi:hypothetical protein VKT23_006293 [Stygiomarasmius scandens]|uniref:Uncharacterized protein n=1 Tax=Marasmiellus scandens TaxID=2682957 RepID=A0ABR1JQP3_9AGAR